MARPQSELLSAAGTVFEVGKRLIEEIINHGGGDEHFRRILKDPDVVKEWAKKMVGRVWKFVGEPIDLNVNWAASHNKMVETALVCIAAGIGIQKPDQPYFTEDRPSGKPRYKLVHYEGTISADEVIWHNVVAGFRELLAYVSQNDVGPCRIVALGSRSISGLREECTTYPIFSRNENDKAEPKNLPGMISWHGFKKFEPVIFGSEWFFLVRVPQ